MLTVYSNDYMFNVYFRNVYWNGTVTGDGLVAVLAGVGLLAVAGPALYLSYLGQNPVEVTRVNIMHFVLQFTMGKCTRVGWQEMCAFPLFRFLMLPEF